MTLETALPVVFLAMMGLAMLLYVILDGYDLGVGMLLPLASDHEKDLMVSSIGPFWDANETWLVLGVGILLIAFPKAHGMVLTALYLPVAVMLIGLILRGVAFDFRVKARDHHKARWNFLFFAGSLVTALAQGWMLGRYVTGLEVGPGYTLFAALIALALAAAYVMMGACWLILRCEHDLQHRAIGWARTAWPGVAAGLLAISLATPWMSATVRDRWFEMPGFIALLPIPLATALVLLVLRHDLRAGHEAALANQPHPLRPLLMMVAVMLLGSIGLAYGIYPYVVIDRLTIWDAASATESLVVILIGASVTVPMIFGYTVFAYRVFWGKVKVMSYG